MDVRCDKCSSEYELDDTRVTPQGVSVKCTSCGHVFRVSKAAPATRQPTTGDWMIRQASGQVFKFKELTTLQRWIVERRVTRDDEISKTGDTWKRLGDILELASFFQVAEQAAIVPQTQQQQQHGSAPPIEIAVPRIEPVEDARPRKSPVVLVTVASIAAVAVIAAVFLLRQQIASALRPSSSPPPPTATNALADKHIAAGYRELHRDTPQGFLASEQEFEKALALQAANPRALSGATLALCDWAEQAREESQEIDANIKAAAAGKARYSPAEIATMATELGKKQGDAAAKTERAFSYMKRTLELDGGEREGLRAAARYYALTNAQEAFRSITDKANAILADDPEYNYAVGSLKRLDDAALESALAAFQKALDREPDHVGARYRLAELLVKHGDKTRAATQIEEVLKRSPDHARALALKRSLEGPKVEPPKEEAKAVPETFEQLLSKANRARHAERVKLAMELYGRALELKPDNAEALTGLGLCYIDNDHPSNAIAQFQKALAANSRYSDAHMGMAEAFRNLGQKRDAVKHYQRYLDLAPDGNEANVAREALKQLGQE
ncbi:MAG: zinc-ribbon domain-containing protein [Deltaproteobacteria bacterium]|nr:zinc-ribbon domain-containing protein [Deltaproteobacteria bacterium]